MNQKPQKNGQMPYATIAAAIILLLLAGVFGLFKAGVFNGVNSSANNSQMETSSFSSEITQSASDSEFSSESSFSEDEEFSVQIQSEGFFSEDGRIYYDNETAAYGIDVSEYQGTIDWEAVSASGVDFAMIRAGLRGYGTPNLVQDKMFDVNSQSAISAGIEIGVYFFSQAVTIEEAVEEAEFICSVIGDCEVTYPIVIDWERVSAGGSRTRDISGEDVTAFVAAFCKKIQECGYTAGFYFNPTDSSSELNSSLLSDYFFWMAQYNSSVPNLDYNFNMWQYSNTGSVPGIDGNVDLDIFFSNYRKGQK